MRKDFYYIYRSLFLDYLYEKQNDLEFLYNRKLRSRKRRHINIIENIEKMDEIIKTIGKQIEYFEIENENYIIFRPDAKYFLLVNFTEMVVNPIFRRLIENNSEDSLKKLDKNIVRDLKTIMNASIESCNKNDSYRCVVTGHMIMETIDKLWQQLSTTKLEVWG